MVMLLNNGQPDKAGDTLLLDAFDRIGQHALVHGFVGGAEQRVTVFRHEDGLISGAGVDVGRLSVRA